MVLSHQSVLLDNQQVMDRLDYYDITPKGMDAYMASHGRHFSKPMLEWAVGMMKDRKGNKVTLPDKKQLDQILVSYGVKVDRSEGFYDPLYVWCMAKADYFGSSLVDDMHMARYVKDFIDDPDGNPTRAFDEFYVNCVAKGVDIPWEDMI